MYYQAKRTTLGLMAALGFLVSSSTAYAIGEEGALLLMAESSSPSSPPAEHRLFDVVHVPTPHMVEVISNESIPATINVRGYPASPMTMAGYLEAAKCPGWRVMHLTEASMVYRVVMANKACALEMAISIPKYKTHPGTLKLQDAISITRQANGTVVIKKENLVYAEITQ